MVDLTLINLKNRISEKKNELKNYKLTSNENDIFNKHYTSVHQIIAYETYLNELLKKYKPRDNMKYVEVEVEKPVYEETVIDRPVDRPVEKIVTVEDNEKIKTMTQQLNDLKDEKNALENKNAVLIKQMTEKDDIKKIQEKLNECNKNTNILKQSINKKDKDIENEKKIHNDNIELLINNHEKNINELNTKTQTDINNLTDKLRNYVDLAAEVKKTKKNNTELQKIIVNLQQELNQQKIILINKQEEANKKTEETDTLKKN